MYCDKNQFPELTFCGPYNKPHGVRGLSKNYHIFFGNKLVHSTCEICYITYASTQFKSTIDQPWTPGIPQQQQPCYQPVKYCT